MICIKVNIEEINKLSFPKNRRLFPRETIHGYLVINADILTDEKTWGFAFNYLKSCEQIELTYNDFPKPNMP